MDKELDVCDSVLNNVFLWVSYTLRLSCSTLFSWKTWHRLHRVEFWVIWDPSLNQPALTDKLTNLWYDDLEVKSAVNHHSTNPAVQMEASLSVCPSVFSIFSTTAQPIDFPLDGRVAGSTRKGAASDVKSIGWAVMKRSSRQWFLHSFETVNRCYYGICVFFWSQTQAASSGLTDRKPVYSNKQHFPPFISSSRQK